MATPDPRLASRLTHPSGRAAKAVLPALLVLALFALPASAAGLHATGEEETILPGSGIHYPGGYDPNSAAVVDGKIEAIHWPCCGPVSLTLATPRDRFTVLTAPASHWTEAGLTLTSGMAVRVTGSKAMGRDGKLYLVASEVIVASTGAVIPFRDAGGNPRWKCPKNARGHRSSGQSMSRGRKMFLSLENHTP
jgi:hypothetical protein